MQKADINPGKEYAVREGRSRDTPLQRVRILEHVRGSKWKAEWIAPNPGLIDYAESRWIIVPWKDRKALLRDEEAEARILEENDRLGYSDRSPLANALSIVFSAAGEAGVSFWRGFLTGAPDGLSRVRTRANFKPSSRSPLAYVDRKGTGHVPFSEALQLAKAFCAAEPAPVLARVEATEREWSAESIRPGREYLVGLLNEYRAAWALIRQWAGHDPAVRHREVHIQRLERLVWDAVCTLQEAGLDDEANRLRRAIGEP